MMKKGNNKGFSLIEIIIGIGMLSVIVIPILHTFITSAQINRDSRQIMIQTEVAQTIMEGFAGKTYLDVKAAVGELAGNPGVVSGNLALSSIDDNLFNTVGSYYSSNDDSLNLKNALTAVSSNSVTWQGGSITTQSLVSDNSVMASMNQAYANDLAQKFNSIAVANGTEGRIFTYCIPDTASGAALFIGYGNIHYEGYRFDAVVSFLPMAETANDMYYTYRILLTLYEYKPEMSDDERCQHVLMTMDGGIMAGR
ncbi:MAG: type II secretion system GspH family protein [Lachnospiraceae bacterium]|nr:type II secretion system GspH family protein [Lachnospiraceae bacterium]